MARGRNPLAASGARTGARGASAEGAPISVSEAVALAKGAMNAMPALLVSGEVSGFRGPNARSGHCYFQVKDDSSSMDVIVWRSTYTQLGFSLRDGMSLVMRGRFDVYVGSGRLSFIASEVSLAGEGMLRQQVAALARKLEAEGLMDESRKRRIPRFCTRVCVVTSLSGSVIEDVKRTLRRRNPLVELDVVGCAVQGPGAAATIIYALAVAARSRPEAILLVRGGGSFEDLMTFNDEALARAVAACPVPVICGIGHEPDTCICDMVADRRASTPTAAAESVAPAIDEVVLAIEGRRQRMGSALEKLVASGSQMASSMSERAEVAVRGRILREKALLDALGRRRCLEDPLWFVEDHRVQLMQSEQRLHDAIPRILARDVRDLSRLSGRLTTLGEGLVDADVRDTEQLALRLRSAGESVLAPFEAKLSRLAATLDALSPLKVLSRGYAIATDESGHVIERASDVEVGQSVRVRLAMGALVAEVCQVEDDEEAAPTGAR